MTDEGSSVIRTKFRMKDTGIIRMILVRTTRTDEGSFIIWTIVGPLFSTRSCKGLAEPCTIGSASSPTGIRP